MKIEIKNKKVYLELTKREARTIAWALANQAQENHDKFGNAYTVNSLKRVANILGKILDDIAFELLTEIDTMTGVK